MPIYRNNGGNSGVHSFEIGNDNIIVTFSTGASYLYNYDVTGSNNIENMKSLALAGHGLNSFINSNVKYKYAAKLN